MHLSCSLITSPPFLFHLPPPSCPPPLQLMSQSRTHCDYWSSLLPHSAVTPSTPSSLEENINSGRGGGGLRLNKFFCVSQLQQGPVDSTKWCPSFRTNDQQPCLQTCEGR
jgi:hypothetical protein